MERKVSVARRTVGFLAAISSAALLITGCATNAGTDAETPEAAVESVGEVRIGIGSDPATAVYVIAHEQGFFAANGVDSELRQFASGGEAVAAQVSGEIELSSVTEPPFLGAYDKGAELGIMGTISVADENFGGVVGPEITDPKDLTQDGVRVGVTQNSGAHYFLERFAQANDFDLADVDLAYLQVSDLVASFTRGDVQAVFTWTPNVQQAEAAVEGAHVIAYSGDVGFPTTMYTVATNDLIDNQELAVAVTRALIEAADWIEANREEALQIMSDTFSVPADALEFPMSLFTYNVDFTQEQVDTFTSVAEWMVKSDLISSVPDTSGFVRTEALLEADAGRVSVTQ